MAVHGVSAYNEEGGRRRRKRMEKVERWKIMMNNIQIITHHHHKMMMICDSQVKYCNFENAAIFKLFKSWSIFDSQKKNEIFWS